MVGVRRDFRRRGDRFDALSRGGRGGREGRGKQSDSPLEWVVVPVTTVTTGLRRLVF